MFLSVFDNFLGSKELKEIDKELKLIKWPKIFNRADSYMLECNDILKYPILKKLYKDDNIKKIGYHYYMTPETAKEGLKVFYRKKDLPVKKVTFIDYKNVTSFDYYKKS